MQASISSYWALFKNMHFPNDGIQAKIKSIKDLKYAKLIPIIKGWVTSCRFTVYTINESINNEFASSSFREKIFTE